jgi:23S rRNA pseudouridine2605 synthase
MAQERLQKILAAAGVASRRKAEELITAGRISVNGEKITALGSKADVRSDEVRLDGALLRGPERHVYIVLHKPKGYITTVSDPEGRPTVLNLLAGVEARVFPVGRLDYGSEGLLLLTNDGELMQQLTKPAAHVPKTYQVKVSGTPTEEEIDKLRGGIHLPPETSRAGTMGGTLPGMPRRTQSVHTLPARIELVRQRENPWYEVTLTEGRNRQIRRMFEQIGHHVEKIKRIRYGPLHLDVEPGKWRYLKPRELEALRNPKAPREEIVRPQLGKRDAKIYRDPGERSGPPASVRRATDGTDAMNVRSGAKQRSRPPQQKPWQRTAEPPVRGARSEGREFPARPPQQKPWQRTAEPPVRGARSEGREFPARPPQQKPWQCTAKPPVRGARSEGREFPARPRQQRPDSAERPPRREFGSAGARPSRPRREGGFADRKGPGGTRPRREGGSADRKGPGGARPFEKARGPKSAVRRDAKSGTDRRPSRTPGRYPRDKKR